MKRILYVEHNTDGTIGGSHLCLLEICRGLDRSRYQAVVCFFQDNSLVPAFKAAGAQVVFGKPWIPVRFGQRGFGFVGRLVRAALNVTRMLLSRPLRWLWFFRKHRIDLVHLNNACGFDHDVMLAAWLFRIPCIVHERGIETSLSEVAQFFARRVERIITISDAVQDNLLRLGIPARKMLRIDDGINPDRLPQQSPVERLREDWRVPSGAPVIGIVGNIKYWKGQETVIRAAHRLKPSFPDLRCFLVGAVGESEYKARLDGLVGELGLQATVIFTGFQRRPTDLVALFDVCVHASVEPEPFGLVLLEAMGKGKPLIATNIGAPREIVMEGQTGFLTPPADDVALAKRLELLLRDPKLRNDMGARGRERFLARYTADRNVERIQSLYDDVYAGT